jgi:hypothetical protein
MLRIDREEEPPKAKLDGNGNSISLVAGRDLD